MARASGTEVLGLLEPTPEIVEALAVLGDPLPALHCSTLYTARSTTACPDRRDPDVGEADRRPAWPPWRGSIPPCPATPPSRRTYTSVTVTQ
jgi:hypothetical protein